MSLQQQAAEISYMVSDNVKLNIIWDYIFMNVEVAFQDHCGCAQCGINISETD